MTKHNLEVDYRKHFNKITADKEAVSCLIDIGKEEVMCSKNLAMVATEVQGYNAKKVVDKRIMKHVMGREGGLWIR